MQAKGPVSSLENSNLVEQRQCQSREPVLGASHQSNVRRFAEVGRINNDRSCHSESDDSDASFSDTTSRGIKRLNSAQIQRVARSVRLDSSGS